MIRIGSWVLVIASLLLALILMIVPLPNWANWSRPEWVLLVIIYWVLAEPSRMGIGIAWIAGLLLDLLYGSVLGTHSFSLVLVAYFINKFYVSMSLFKLLHRTVVVGLIILLYKIILFLLNGMLGEPAQSFWYWMPVITTVIFWPWANMLLNDLCHRLRILQ